MLWIGFQFVCLLKCINGRRFPFSNIQKTPVVYLQIYCKYQILSSSKTGKTLFAQITWRKPCLKAPKMIEASASKQY